MNFSKLVLASLFAGASFASTSAVAVTRSCDTNMIFDITSGPADGYTSGGPTFSGSAGTVFLARKEARRNAQAYFEGTWITRNDPSVRSLIASLPRGNYTANVQLLVYQTSGYGCGGADRRTVSFTK
jgi:hypothetical protein